MLKLGWTYNLLHLDNLAFRWFGLARNSSDQAIAAEASKAYGNLRPSFARFRTTMWIYPMYSSRWSDAFGYGQIKTELKLGRSSLSSLRFAPHGRRYPRHHRRRAAAVSFRKLRHFRSRGGEPLLARNHGLGRSRFFGQLSRPRPAGVGRVTPDYRSGVSFFKGFGHGIGGEAPGWFLETNADGIYVSRYGNDFLLYAQTRDRLDAARAGNFRDASLLEQQSDPGHAVAALGQLF